MKGHEIPATPLDLQIDESTHTLASQAASQLRDMIAQNELPPGTRIRERAIAQKISVSRTPLREALRILAVERLVEILPNRGAVVAVLQPNEIEGLLGVLGVLEAFAGEEFCAKASDEDIAEVRALHFEMLAAYERKNQLEYFKINQAIHLAIVEGADNPSLQEVHGQINARLYRVRYQSNLTHSNWHTAIAEHHAILDALTKRDGSALSSILRAHLGTTWSNMKAGFSVEQNKETGEEGIFAHSEE